MSDEPTPNSATDRRDRPPGERQDDPHAEVRKATGRVLTKLIIAVGGLQVAGVMLWLVLVFTGVMDASENLGEFIVSQFGVFFASVAIGIGWAVYRIRQIRNEAGEQ